jgi:hypothetical protein
MFAAAIRGFLRDHLRADASEALSKKVTAGRTVRGGSTKGTGALVPRKPAWSRFLMQTAFGHRLRVGRNPG